MLHYWCRFLGKVNTSVSNIDSCYSICKGDQGEFEFMGVWGFQAIKVLKFYTKMYDVHYKAIRYTKS